MKYIDRFTGLWCSQQAMLIFLLRYQKRKSANFDLNIFDLCYTWISSISQNRLRFFQLYIKETNYLSRRITAPFPNPYDYGFVMIFFSLYFLSLFNTKNNFRYLALFFIASALILLTQSRSMLFSFILANIIILPMFSIIYFGGLRRFKFTKVDAYVITMPLFVMVLGVFVIITYSDKFTYLLNGIYKIIANPFYNGVTDNRIDQLSFIILTITDNPILTLFGNGPAKGEMDDVESIYSYYLFRYGVFGLIIGFLYPAFLGAWCSNLIAKQFNKNTLEYTMFRVFQMWFIIVPFISLGNNHTEQIRVSFFYTVLLGFVAARADALKGANCA